MWARLNSDGDTIEEIIVKAQGLTVDNINHPRALFTLWTDEERLAIGVVPVTTTGTHLDTAFYIEADPTYAIAGDKSSVVRTIGVKSSDKALEDVDSVDENGDARLDYKGNQAITRGLKYNAKNKTTTNASGLLKGFGWLIQRKVTASVAIPSAVTTYMAAIRTDHGNICTAIDGANTMTKFIALHNDTYKADGTLDVVARVNRWTSDANVKAYRR